MQQAATRCVCCGDADSIPHLRVLHRCNKCGHVWADMSLTDEQVSQLYAEGYFTGEEYLDYSREAPALERNFKNRTAELLRLHPEGGRLFEIGAAYGYFQRIARQHFVTSGCDVSAHAVEFACRENGANVRTANYLTMPPPDQPDDIICMWDTIEHLNEPDRFIRKAFAELRPGGTLALSTGDIGSLNARIQGAKWRLIHPPTHLHYFTVHSMTTLLTNAGFREVRISHPVFWRSADASAHHLLANPPDSRTAWLYSLLRRSGLTGFSFPLNLFDLMTVFGTK